MEPDPELIDLPSSSDIFRFEKTIQVTAPDRFRTGCFCRIGYIPAKDRFAITFTTGHDLMMDESDTCSNQDGYEGEKGQAYTEFTLDLEDTGVHGYTLTRGGGDTYVEMHLVTSSAFFGTLS